MPRAKKDIEQQPEPPPSDGSRVVAIVGCGVTPHPLDPKDGEQ